MMSNLARVKQIVMDLLEDGREHTSDELREQIKKEGVELPKKAVHSEPLFISCATVGLRFILGTEESIKYRRKKRHTRCWRALLH